MVCSCVVPSKRVLLKIIFCSCVIGTTLSREKWQIACLSCRKWLKYENKLGDRMVKQLLNSVIAKYRDLSAFVFDKELICSPLTNHNIFVNVPCPRTVIFLSVSVLKLFVPLLVNNKTNSIWRIKFSISEHYWAGLLSRGGNSLFWAISLFIRN